MLLQFRRVLVKFNVEFISDEPTDGVRISNLDLNLVLNFYFLALFRYDTLGD
jgi:hypothetical protein